MDSRIQEEFAQQLKNIEIVIGRLDKRLIAIEKQLAPTTAAAKKPKAKAKAK